MPMRNLSTTPKSGGRCPVLMRTKQRPPDLGKPFVVSRFRIGMDALLSHQTLVLCAFLGLKTRHVKHGVLW